MAGEGSEEEQTEETKQCHAEAKRLQSQWEDGGLSVSAGHSNRDVWYQSRPEWHRSQ